MLTSKFKQKLYSLPSSYLWTPPETAPANSPRTASCQSPHAETAPPKSLARAAEQVRLCAKQRARVLLTCRLRLRRLSVTPPSAPLPFETPPLLLLLLCNIITSRPLWSLIAVGGSWVFSWLKMCEMCQAAVWCHCVSVFCTSACPCEGMHNWDILKTVAWDSFTAVWCWRCLWSCEQLQCLVFSWNVRPVNPPEVAAKLPLVPHFQSFQMQSWAAAALCTTYRLCTD